MYRFVQSILAIVLILNLMGCNQDPKSSTNGTTEETTITKYWTGQQKNAVSSRDIGICGKSKVAKRNGSPGFIMINFLEEPLTYHSTELVVKFSSESMIDTGYKLGSLSLWTKSESTKEIYIGKMDSSNKPNDLVVYQIGGCL
ncbi:hypothetical protein [Gottfriedia solisilvae]|uniref:Uncharacterized protein n=1 Tax=Gottfriedia solisilvae TaxID=1516104 RepID=A0A8J3AKI7_9BACI|nr:hypothetical protein [Gottfriedia solisilvae]GGI11803.1 hypothetical protein GCM10007380_09670 [Gottfriedia solisilvae]